MTVLSATSGLYTLLLGRAAGVETFSAAKLAAVVMRCPHRQSAQGTLADGARVSIVGVAMVSRSDQDVGPIASPAHAASETTSGRLRLLGDALALTSAFLYGCYVILLKLRIRSESRIQCVLSPPRRERSS